jgi:large subunit ribosomal protein L40
MKNAMNELQKVDNYLYIEANKKEDPKTRTEGDIEALKGLQGTEIRTLDARIRGLFPRELKIPVDTPSKSGWNYEWRPFPRPL